MTDTVSSECVDVFDAALPRVEYLDARNSDEAARRCGAAQAQAAIAIGSFGPEILRYDLVRSVLRDARFHTPPGLGLELQGITSGPLWERVGETILGKNGVDHHRLRKLVAKVFTPRGAERLRSAIVAVITELLDQVTTAGSCDVVAQIARPYPVPVICAALGAPRGDWQLISHWADELTNMTRNAADESAVLRELGAWDSYIDDMVATRRRNLTDDLLSDLIRAEADGEHLTAEELRALVGTLLMAGTDTTRNQLAASVEALCEHPRQWELLGRRPEMAPRAVEETMRYTPVLFTALRMATEDVELDGVLIRSGTLVVVNTGAANRDPDVFDNPDQLDITRDAAPPMLTFGNGAHYCLGAHLARIELAEALRLMAQRMPNIRRAGEAPWKPISGISGPTSLLVEFDVV